MMGRSKSVMALWSDRLVERSRPFGIPGLGLGTHPGRAARPSLGSACSRYVESFTMLTMHFEGSHAEFSRLWSSKAGEAVATSRSGQHDLTSAAQPCMSRDHWHSGQRTACCGKMLALTGAAWNVESRYSPAVCINDCRHILNAARGQRPAPPTCWLPICVS